MIWSSLASTPTHAVQRQCVDNHHVDACLQVNLYEILSPTAVILSRTACDWMLSRLMDDKSMYTLILFTVNCICKAI